MDDEVNVVVEVEDKVIEVLELLVLIDVVAVTVVVDDVVELLELVVDEVELDVSVCVLVRSHAGL